MEIVDGDYESITEYYDRISRYENPPTDAQKVMIRIISRICNEPIEIPDTFGEAAELIWDLHLTLKYR